MPFKIHGVYITCLAAYISYLYIVHTNNTSNTLHTVD